MDISSFSVDDSIASLRTIRLRPGSLQARSTIADRSRSARVLPVIRTEQIKIFKYFARNHIDFLAKLTYGVARHREFNLRNNTKDRVANWIIILLI